MLLQTLPLVFVLAGLVLYTVLAGADFGAGMWHLLAGRGERGDAIREHAHHSMGPVWEANHVWLIFVLTVTWTAYPTFFGSVASTLSVPFFLAALGIILRGASYALRSGAGGERELRVIDGAFAVASLLTPFALGAMAGGIAVRAGAGRQRRRPPVLQLAEPDLGADRPAGGRVLGLPGGRLSWPPTPRARGEPELAAGVPARARWAPGVVAGALAVAGLVVVHSDAHSLYHGLVHGAALAVLIVSLLAGAGDARRWCGCAASSSARYGGGARRRGGRRRLGVRPLSDAAARTDRVAGGVVARHAGDAGGGGAGGRGDPVPVAGAAVLVDARRPPVPVGADATDDAAAGRAGPGDRRPSARGWARGSPSRC